MGEVTLRKIQAGLETTRGTAVAATKKVYGTMTIQRAQPRRFAVEDRGNYTDKFRANKKLVEAGFTLVADATFEDMPFFASQYLNGGITATGGAGVGYTWSFVPDTNTDSLKTFTYEAGDDTVAWQGNFGTIDSADFTLNLDDALSGSFTGFTQDWTPQSYSAPGLVTAFTGFTGSIAERTVESVMGYQQRLYIDNTGTAAGTTQVTGRYINATISIKNQNKKKFFGDGVAYFTKLGRGRRQVSATVQFEALDTNQYADFYNNTSKVVRIQLIGSAIPSTTFGATNGALTGGTTITAITTSALTAAIPAGTGISLAGQTFAVTAAGAASSATSIPVQSQTVGATIPTTTTVMAAKTINFDVWGVYDAFTIQNRETNTTFQFTVQAMYDATPAKELAITVVNGSNVL